uniref:Uncharacterized protein n=1 Tax=Mustela putorius furo TaxID=9669 RepID=M3Z7L1_MUSPF
MLTHSEGDTKTRQRRGGLSLKPGTAGHTRSPRKDSPTGPPEGGGPETPGAEASTACGAQGAQRRAASTACDASGAQDTGSTADRVGYREEAPPNAAGFQQIRTGLPHATITARSGQPTGLRHWAPCLPLWKRRAPPPSPSSALSVAPREQGSGSLMVHAGSSSRKPEEWDSLVWLCPSPTRHPHTPTSSRSWSQGLTAVSAPSPPQAPHGARPVPSQGQASAGCGGAPGTHARHGVLILNDDLPEKTPLIVLVHGDTGQAQPAGRGQLAEVSLGQEGQDQDHTTGSSPRHCLVAAGNCAVMAGTPTTWRASLRDIEVGAWCTHRLWRPQGVGTGRTGALPRPLSWLVQVSPLSLGHGARPRATPPSHAAHHVASCFRPSEVTSCPPTIPSPEMGGWTRAQVVPARVPP